MMQHHLSGKLFKSISYFIGKQKSLFLEHLPLLGFLIIIFFISKAGLDYEEQRSRRNTINILNSTLNHTYQSIKEVWTKSHFINANLSASHPIIVENTIELLKIKNNKKGVIKSKPYENLIDYYNKNLNEPEIIGLDIISPDFNNIASTNTKNIGTKNIVFNHYKTGLEKAFTGNNQVIPPIPSNIPLKDKNEQFVDAYPAMFILAPIKDKNKSIIAIISIHIDPFKDFSSITQTARFGNTGETYIVNRDGKLITESRFLEELNKIGLLENKKYSILNVEIRNPGINLTQVSLSTKPTKVSPLTYAAKNTLEFKTGESKIAYRDYRGVPVLGTWKWDNELEMGFITEIDEDEAMESYKNTKLLIISLIMATIILLSILSFLNWKKQEQNIKEIELKEKYLLTLFNNNIDGITIFDKSGKIEKFNRTAEITFGYKANEVIGRNVSILMAPDQNKNEDQDYFKVKKKGINSFNREIIGLKKDDTSFPLLLRIGKIKLKERKVYMGITRDISLKKEAEKTLNAIEEKFERTFSQAPISMAITNINGDFNKVNQAFCKLFGYTENELLSKNFSEITFKNDLEASRNFMSNIKEGRISEFSLEKRYHKKNKEVIWALSKISVLKDELEKIKSLIVTIEDITFKKQTEDNLNKQSKQLELSNIDLVKSKKAALSMMQDTHIQRELVEKANKKLEISNQKLKKLNHAIEQSLASVIITNKKGFIEYVNPAFTKASGYTFEEVVNHPAGIIRSDKNSNEFYKNIWSTILSGKTWKGDYINKKKSGEEYWESASISPVLDEKGEITHFVAIREDISQRKILEEELVKSKELAEEANKAKSLFLANMSHEIRTPMNAIIGFSEILSKHIKNEAQIEYIDAIQSSGKTLLKLINNILDLSKIESGKLNLNYDATNIKILVEEMTTMFRVKAEDKNLQLKAVFLNGVLNTIIEIDELRVKQVLINIINNAIKFTKNGFVKIEVSSTNQTNKHFDLVFKIEDTGIGIPQRYQKKIFHEFDQIDELDNKKYEGTGLGLAISQQLVKQMNGKIDLDSEVGKGSIFTLTFKKVKIVDEQPLNEIIVSNNTYTKFEESTVLIVDDVKTNRDVLKGYLQDYNIDCIEAANGKEALSLIKKHKPDLIFLDLKMPIMDGFKTNEAIQKHPKWRKTPVIAITATTFNNDENKIIDLGFSGFLRKPANSDKILSTLQFYLKHTVVVNDQFKKPNSITLDNILELDNLLLEIKERAVPIYERIKVIRKTKDILLLAHCTVEIGKKYDVIQLINFGNELLSASKLFNINNERKLILEFSKVFKNQILTSNGE